MIALIMQFDVAAEISKIEYARYCVLEAQEWPDLRPLSFNDFVEQSPTLDGKIKLAILNAKTSR